MFYIDVLQTFHSLNIFCFVCLFIVVINCLVSLMTVPDVLHAYIEHIGHYKKLDAVCIVKFFFYHRKKMI